MFSYPRSPIHPPFAPGSLRCWMMWRYYWHASNLVDQGDMTQIFKFPHKNTKKTLLANNHLCIYLAKATTRKLNHPMEAVKLLAIRPSWAKGRTWWIPKESIFKMPVRKVSFCVEAWDFWGHKLNLTCKSFKMSWNCLKGICQYANVMSSSENNWRASAT